MTRPDGCPSWCTEHSDGTWHGHVLAEGFATESHGHLYRVALEATPERTKLWIEVNSITLTADQADVLAAALTEGAQILRESGNPSPAVSLTPYLSIDNEMVHTPEAVYPLTLAERRIREARMAATP